MRRLAIIALCNIALSSALAAWLLYQDERRLRLSPIPETPEERAAREASEQLARFLRQSTDAIRYLRKSERE